MRFAQDRPLQLAAEQERERGLQCDEIGLVLSLPNPKCKANPSWAGAGFYLDPLGAGIFGRPESSCKLPGSSISEPYMSPLDATVANNVHRFRKSQ